MTIQLYHGDCLEFMRTLPAGSVDAVVTDPPYGVDFKYASYDDTQNGYEEWILVCLAEMRRVAQTVIITPGITHLFAYPRPKWTCCYFKPGSTRHNGVGGFNEWEPILVYADKVRINTDAKRFPDCVNHVKGVMDHPCPKPLNVFRWLVDMADGTTVFDPFMGSGTTGVACVQTGRSFIGCEIDAGYFEIARKRIEQAQMQMHLPLDL
jgi:DNA modification methylase